MATDHGPTVKDDTLYEDLRRDGASKAKAARIANAKAAGTLDHRGTTLEDRSKSDLLKEAREIGIDGRLKMSKRNWRRRSERIDRLLSTEHPA